jgi:hypothetical protein
MLSGLLLPNQMGLWHMFPWGLVLEGINYTTHGSMRKILVWLRKSSKTVFKQTHVLWGDCFLQRRTKIIKNLFHVFFLALFAHRAPSFEMEKRHRCDHMSSSAPLKNRCEEWYVLLAKGIGSSWTGLALGACGGALIHSPWFSAFRRLHLREMCPDWRP